MDLHDLGRGRNGITRALERIRTPIQVISINSDALYPPYQQEDLYRGLIQAGAEAGFVSIDSVEGHDGFLLAIDAIAPIVASFLAGGQPGGRPGDPVVSARQTASVEPSGFPDHHERPDR